MGMPACGVKSRQSGEVVSDINSVGKYTFKMYPVTEYRKHSQKNCAMWVFYSESLDYFHIELHFMECRNAASNPAY